MKGQQLIYSFLPGVTAAVLTSQPALAGAMKISGVQLASSPSVLTVIDSQSLVADNSYTQIPNTADKTFLNGASEPGLTGLTTKFFSSESTPVLLTENTVIPIAQKLNKDYGRLFSLTPALNSEQKPQPNNSLSNKKQIGLATVEQQSKKIVVPASISKLRAEQQKILSRSSLQQPAAQTKAPETQLPTVLQTAVRSIGAAKLLEVKGCSQDQGSLPSLLLTSTGCQYQSSRDGELLAQSTTPAPAEAAPASPPAGTVTPAPAEAAPASPPAGTVTPAPAGAVPVPENLNQNPNPLQYPTKTEEVTLQGNQPITLAQALELARRNNRDLQVSLLELQRNQEALREAQAALLPNFTLSAEMNRGRSVQSTINSKTQNQLTGGNADPAPTNTTFTSQAELTYNLYTSGRRLASIRQAEEQVRFNELDVERQSEEIRLNVTTDYYNLQQADEQVRIAQSAVQNAQASLRDAQALERAGVGTRFDVLRSQVNLANAQQDLTNALGQQQIARRQLATRLGLSQAGNISAADPVQLAGLWNQTLEQSIILAFQNRPELQQQLAQRNINEQQRRQALADLGPQVSLVANYQLSDIFDDNINVSDGYSVGVRASLNLYDGGAARARASQALTNIAIAETNFASQRDQIRFQVEQAFSNQRSNLENVQTANTALEQAREALRLARLRFQAGVGTQTDVINSENDLTRAEGNRVQAILDYNRALAQLQRAVTSRALR